ncbi:MAG: DUF4286 family protein [Acidobacteriota bacterium]
MRIAYTVACTFTDPDVAARWLHWLESEHLADVVAAGALDAHAVRLDGEPLRCEARYTFASREAFQAYERDHAPRLREEGLTLFPLDLGLEYARSVGVIVATA